MKDPSKPVFWRDWRMPYVELRKVVDGRQVCYAPHSHTQWSLGAITEGQSTFLYRGGQFKVSAGNLVIVNPDWVHACNPIDNQPWGYLMLYVDTDWLTNLRYEAGLLETPCWEDIATATMPDHEWYAGYCRIAECLLGPDRELLEKQTAVVEYLTALMHELSGQAAEPRPKAPDNLQAVADYLKAHASEEVSLDTLCERSGYSPGHLIRSFKHHFGFTPHAYLINYRVQYGQRELKRGKPIAETAVNAGFSDQPHFQRTFKKLLAATPKQYRQSLLNQQIDTAGGK
ncbi:AraC family transcriptional regulator [Marinobacter sp. ANT_B65]|uniref:AraC family transcriptional regulator n=1 Tax=Marinobacter sp. ANT_B65 TaxID=2039467 RepID=UPI000BBF15A7|nr:AraC family transcriptional regulator [Marinobacter sp. ANT_B65]PCM45804.1 AraC family transcriptional regulator [Marinobacter sp. ANT_B65]